MSDTDQVASTSAGMSDAYSHAPVALPPIHLPRWLVNRLGIGEYSRSYESEIVSGILIQYLAASVAEPAEDSGDAPDAQKAGTAA